MCLIFFNKSKNITDVLIYYLENEKNNYIIRNRFNWNTLTVKKILHCEIILDVEYWNKFDFYFKKIYKVI